MNKDFSTSGMFEKILTAALKVILVEEFCECFQQWQHCLANCVSDKGDCSEGGPFHEAVMYRNICSEVILGILSHCSHTLCCNRQRWGSFEYNHSQVQGLLRLRSVECNSWQGLAEHLASFLKVSF